MNHSCRAFQLVFFPKRLRKSVFRARVPCSYQISKSHLASNLVKASLTTSQSHEDRKESDLVFPRHIAE